ncbi:MAG: response regulator [Eubacteriales bacterium]|nr:response regulator [Eubacteriales bacterium]
MEAANKNGIVNGADTEKEKSGVDAMEEKKELYNILLVDDEADVLQVMKKKINWESIGFCMAGTAENGEEALEIAEQTHIDVVLTDIKMPFMDGLVLCRKLKENYRNMKVVIYSGFDEFKYAREAIHLEAEEYLLKPISAKDLTQVFQKIKSSLDKEIAERRNIDMLREYYQKSLPAMQEQLVISILEGRIAGERARALMKMYELNLSGDCYAAAILEGRMGVQKEEHPQLFNLSLKNLADDYLKDKLGYYSVNYLDKIVFIFLLEQKEDLQKLLYHLEQICKTAFRMLGMKSAAAVGQVVTDLMNITTSYQEAGHAMEYRKIIGEDSPVIYIKDMEPRPQASVELPEYNYQDILRAVKLGNSEETSQAICQFTNALRHQAMTPGQYQAACVELLMEFTKIGRSYQLDIRDIFGQDRIPWEKIDRFSSLGELEEWLNEICTKLRKLLRHERRDSTMRLTEKAKEYIEEHYAQSDLSADTLCRYLNVSAAYFSTIFKREVGLGFAAYLTKTRLEHAVELLMSTQEKTYIIAEAVGYPEPNYFSYVFKKEYGVSPTKYRAGLQKKEK